jgi:hypothetical protein
MKELSAQRLIPILGREPSGMETIEDLLIEAIWIVWVKEGRNTPLG